MVEIKDILIHGDIWEAKFWGSLFTTTLEGYR